jgi:voltage-gated potassium channel
VKRGHHSLRFSGLTITILLVIGLVFVGIMGFHLIADFSFLDAIYMTVITVTTVGFGEVVPLDSSGKIFTIFLILCSWLIIGYAAATIYRYASDGYFQKKLKDYNVKKRITKLRNHVIVCGYGRNGYQACEELAEHNIDFIIIEMRDNVVEYIRENPEHLFIQGDAASEEVLELAQIKHAKALITALPKDSDNMYVVLTAREMNPDLQIISRASEFRSDVKLRRVGADNVIMPDRIGGQRMAKLVAQPDVVEFWEYVLLQRVKDVSLETISCHNAPSNGELCTLKELALREKSGGANIVGIKTHDGNFIFNPSPDFELKKSDMLFVLGSPSQISVLRSMLG